MSDITTTDKTERLKLANDAALDIDALLRILPRALNTDSEDVEMEVMLTASLRHLRALNTVVLKALGDDDTNTTQDLREVLHG